MIYFVETKASEQRVLLCQWVEFFYESGRKVQVLVDSTLAAQQLDRMLWTFSQSSFVPHRIHSTGDSEVGPETVVISVGEVFMPDSEVLVCDTPGGLDFLDRYPVVLHFVFLDEPERLQASRMLWQQAKENKSKVQHVPYASNHPRFGWPPRDRSGERRPAPADLEA